MQKILDVWVVKDLRGDADPSGRGLNGGGETRMRARIYVCHTFYHVYVACLKELIFRRKNAEKRIWY